MPGTRTMRWPRSDSAALLERRIIPGNLEIREDDGKTILVGHAAVFYDGTPDTEFKWYGDLVERVDKKAFNTAIKEDDVRALFNHDSNNVLGRNKAKTLALSVDERGLVYEIDVGDTAIAAEVVKHVERGDVTGSSFSFVSLEEEWAKNEDGEPDVRTIKKVRLYDVGPVTFPAYKGTDATIRAEGGPDAVCDGVAFAQVRAVHQRWLARLQVEDRTRILRKKRLDTMAPAP